MHSTQIIRPTPHEEKTISEIVGSTIMGVRVLADGTTILTLRRGRMGYMTATVLADPEGNGPGHLSVSRGVAMAQHIGGVGGR